MTKLSRHTPGQESLLTHALDGHEMVRDFSSPVPVHEVLDGPSIDLVKRAEHLDSALLLLGKISQRTGLQIAAEGSHRPELQNRYGGQLDRVVEGAAGRKEDMATDTKWHFSQAFGQYALAKSGLLSRDEAGRQTYSSYKDFMSTFADSYNRPRRNAYRKQLKKNQTAILKKQAQNRAS